jgi:hypothetical protein
MKVPTSGRPFKDVVNDALRRGLAVESQMQALPPFKIAPEHRVRLKPGPIYDEVREIFAELDGRH